MSKRRYEFRSNDSKRTQARSEAEKWTVEYKAKVINEFQRKEMITICDGCAEKLVFLPENVMKVAKKLVKNGDPDFIRKVYWLRIGWCEGMGIETAGHNHKCRSCRIEERQKKR